MEKDYEIIRFQKRRADDVRLSKPSRSAAALLGAHHIYSAFRDFSMAVWWAIYGVISLKTDRQLQLILLFGVPYSILVILWSTLKHKVDIVEDEFEKETDWPNRGEIILIP
jgi:hypothetical protein